MTVAAFIVLSLTAALVISAGAFQLAEPTRKSAAEMKRLPVGITLDGVLLSEYTYPLAYQKFNQQTQWFLQNFELKAVVNEREYYLNAEDLSFEINSVDLLNELWFSIDGYNEGSAFSSAHLYDQTVVQEFADNIVEELRATIPPFRQVTPVFNIATRTFSDGYLAGQIIGYDLEPSALLEQIHNKIDEAIRDDAWHHAELNIQSAPIYSEPTTASAAGFGRLSTYTTHTTNVPNRNTNIQLASNYLSGTLVRPGSTFSFNGTLGYTSSARGYKEAGILINGEPSTALGGGICQVSSTMYNAVLDAGLRVVERHPHSAPVGYVPAGRDATVSYGGPDFKFQNNTPNDLYLICDYNNRSLTVSLYGKK